MPLSYVLILNLHKICLKLCLYQFTITWIPVHCSQASGGCGNHREWIQMALQALHIYQLSSCFGPWVTNPHKTVSCISNLVYSHKLQYNSMENLDCNEAVGSFHLNLSLHSSSNTFRKVFALNYLFCALLCEMFWPHISISLRYGMWGSCADEDALPVMGSGMYG